MSFGNPWSTRSVQPQAIQRPLARFSADLAGSVIERCWRAAEALKAAAPAGGEAAEEAFGDFEQAVGKLRNTILVRTQRAT